MNSRERLIYAIGNKMPDKVPKLDISYWPETIERWRGEGLPPELVESDLEDYFGLDKIFRLSYNTSLQLEQQIHYEDDRVRDISDANGVIHRESKLQSFPPAPISSLINNMRDWLEYKSRLAVNSSRISDDSLNSYKRAVGEGDRYMILTSREPVWYALNMFEKEESLVKIIEEPELLYDIASHFTDFTIGMIEELNSKGYYFDAFWFFSDLCYKNGMMFSPGFYREVALPLHKKLFNFIKDRNMQIICHCCGNLKQILPFWIESGIDCIQPMEVRAGNDVREFKQLYGNQISFMGNISVDIMSTTKDAIEEEVRSKVTAAKQGGGYIYHCDHSLPPSVSLENYKHTLALIDHYGKY